MPWSLVISPSIVPPPPPRLRRAHSIVSAAAIIVPGGRGRRSETTPYETRGAAALRPAAGGPVHPCPHAGPLVHGLVVVRRGRLPARLLGAAALPHRRHRGGRRHPLPAALPERAAAAAPDGPPARRQRRGRGRGGSLRPPVEPAVWRRPGGRDSHRRRGAAGRNLRQRPLDDVPAVRASGGLRCGGSPLGKRRGFLHFPPAGLPVGGT